ncbi:DUF928 domain-containing protein [Moorena producens JHB]|uniref:DUF928 domain-containing protein n=1 Tax=Moorena producens (strain JHB) TaxID=1454205 RepID=A0A1D9GB61_MOOP1|nr:DUF928 domain-containing protein [Moorena producens]AOY84882.2 DUF928 domain-containing protein [Moorena producens JHB]
MMLTKLFRLKYLFASNLVFVGWISCFLVSRVEADQSISLGQVPQVPIYYIQPNPKPPDNGTPSAPHGTGTRGDCLYKPELPLLTPLVGGYNFDLTVSDYPTFWIYLPYTSEDAPSGEFSLQDEDGENDLYQTSFNLPDQPGIVSITLPKTEKPLEVGQTYRWNLEINCPSTELSNQFPTPASVTGLVRRVAQSSDLKRELNDAKTPLERIAAYGNHHIWYDTLTELAKLRLQEPQNMTLESAWINLLTDQKFETISKTNLLGNLQ